MHFKGRKYHLIGIGGIGMSGLARLLLAHGAFVSGSDCTLSSYTEALEKLGAIIYSGHLEENIFVDMTVVYSTGVSPQNPERVAAERLGCTLLHRSECLAHLVEDRKGLFVTGTHGKTTTSSLLTAVLKEAEKDPPFCVGGVVQQFGVNAAVGKGEFFVAEADESDGSFLNYLPYGSIVTNIGREHMEYYQTEKRLREAFVTFIQKVSGPLVYCGDDLVLRELTSSGLSYGFSDGCDWKVKNVQQKGWELLFDLEHSARSYKRIALHLIGEHNALNGAAVFALAMELGVPESAIRNAFARFEGVARRCEKRGEHSGVQFIDDYAHHPTEIRTTLDALRKALPKKRLIAIFQPHRFTRTRDCLGAYFDAFNSVDDLVVTDIYTAGETPIPGITPQKILEETKRGRHVPRSELFKRLATFAGAGDVVITLGAGDITYLAAEASS